MDLVWVDARYQEITDSDIQGSRLGLWITQKSRSLKRASGRPGLLIIRFETPDKLVLCFRDEKGTHGRFPKVILERTQFEVDECAQMAVRQLHEYFQQIADT
jgi:hypothetical protein